MAAMDNGNDTGLAMGDSVQLDWITLLPSGVANFSLGEKEY